MRRAGRIAALLPALWILLGIAILPGAVGMARAQSDAAIRRVNWEPQPLAVGSPCVFTVEVGGSAIGVKGHWLGHDLVFTQASQPGKWYALAGVDVEETPGRQELSIEAALPGGETARASREIEIVPSAYKTVELRVPSQFVEPDAPTLVRIAEEKKVKDAAFAHQLPAVEWRSNFVLPVNAPATDSFGTRRVFNGETASIHRGMDFRARVGTRVRAANAGEVVLAKNLFYEGGLVVIDHGQQFMTLYMHLSRIEVTAGEQVRKGQEIGLSGATGRVTGPHLHMAVRWQGAYLDPAKLFSLKLPEFPAK
ncbi:MAG TPA: M23 family metallopeptidase [Acidisarcina sp.]|nr:M23 family metallopeptidase [Acidisarcina sp.]